MKLFSVFRHRCHIPFLISLLSAFSGFLFYFYSYYLQIYEASLLADQVMVCNFFIGPSDLSMQGETMTSTLFVQFYSDFTLSGVGFELSYEQIGGNVERKI